MTTGAHPSKPPFAVADPLARVRATPWLQRFTLMNRLQAPALLGIGLLAMALVIGGGVAGAVRGGPQS